MVTFSDCMTLLLTFFVLLLSFSSFDDLIYWRLKIIYSEALPAITPVTRSNRDSVRQETQIETIQELARGSEKPTLERGETEGLLKEKHSTDAEGGKVVLIPSRKVFWAKGKAISSDGRSFLSLLARFIANTRNRIVISEHGPPTEPDNPNYGLPRAWAVTQFLTKTYGLPQSRFSISATTTLPRDNVGSGGSTVSSIERGRTLEIVFLDRSIHN